MLGNGNSVNKLPQDLTGYYTIGVNCIGAKLSPDILLIVDNMKGFTQEQLAIIKNTKAGYYFVREGMGWEFDRKKTIYWECGRLGEFDNLNLKNNKIDIGFDSPYIAILLAYKLGFRQIDIIGVDFTADHFYKKDGIHKINKRLNKILTFYDRLYTHLTFHGAIIHNLSIESRIKCIPIK